MTCFRLVPAFSSALMLVGCIDRQFHQTSEAKNVRPETQTKDGGFASNGDRLIFSEDFVMQRFQKSGSFDSEAYSNYMAAFTDLTPWYGDSFGLQILKNVSKSDILADFVPTNATIDEDLGNTLKVKWQGGHSFVFHFGKTFNIPFRREMPCKDRDYLSTVSGYSWLWVADTNSVDMTAALKNFVETVKARNLSEKYLVQNPAYSLLKELEEYSQNNNTNIEMTPDPDLTQFRASNDVVLVLPDYHGNQAVYDGAISLLSTEKIDWLGLEFLPRSAQATFDTFYSEPEGSSLWLEAKAKLMTQLPPDVYETCGKAENNHYFALIDLARRKKIRVYGMDGRVEFGYFGPKSPAFRGLSNLNWVDALPQTGRGVMFGGMEHFYNATPGNSVQNFLAKRKPSSKVFVYNVDPK